MRELIDSITDWIKSVVDKAGADGIVLGLSGGVDSAVLCGLCAKAISPDNILAVIMPCYSNEQDCADALKVSEKYGVRYTTINLDSAFDLLKRCAVFSKKGGIQRKVSEGNLKARLRMSVLYFIANQTNYLVAGSDDRSESYVGYFTKYGDGASDFAPLANLTKAEVREMAKELGVPGSVINKPSSPGLWEGQTAEGELGVTYKEIDALLAGEEIPIDVREKIELMHKNTEHKRSIPCTPDIEKKKQATNEMHLCGRGAIYRIWPCKDIDIRVRRKAWPKLGEPCNQINCGNFRKCYYMEAEVISNEKILDYTKYKENEVSAC